MPKPWGTNPLQPKAAPPPQTVSEFEKTLNDLLKENKTMPDPAPTKNNGLKYTFNIYKAANGYVVSCGGKYWVCPDNQDVTEIVKIAIADTRL